MTTDESHTNHPTTKQRYGNDQAAKDVFEDRLRPQPSEMIAALTDTEHLTEKDATAFVYGHLETTPKADDPDVKPSIFDSKARFDSYAFEAKYKVAQAIWIYELIDAYRNPDFPEECRDCGQSLNGTWVGHPDRGDPGVLCTDCADIAPDTTL